MIKLNKYIFIVLIAFLTSFLTSSLMTFLHNRLSKSQFEFLRSDIVVSSFLLIISLFFLMDSVIRVIKIKKTPLEIYFKREKSIFGLSSLLALLSIIAFAYSYKLSSLMHGSIGILLLLLSLEGFITYKAVNGIIDSYIFHKDKKYLIQDIELYEVDLNDIYIRVSEKFFFINLFETIKFSVTKYDKEKVMSLMCFYNKHAVKESTVNK